MNPSSGSRKPMYYDHPDGEDALGKMIFTNKWAFVAGMGWSALEVVLVSKPTGYAKTLGRFVYWTAPAMGMASAFTMTTYAATRIRGKDDKLNYVLGACAAGGVFGGWRGKFISGVYACAIFSLAAVMKKKSLEEGWEFFPKMKHAPGFGGPFIKQHDYTWMAERPRNWTNKREE